MKFTRFVKCLPALLAAVFFVQAARAEWTLTGSDLKPEKGVGINEWSVKDGLSYTQAGGALKTIATRDLVGLASSTTATAREAKWSLTLRNGDVLMGEPVALAKGVLQFTVTDLGTIDVPLKLVSILQATDNPAPNTEIPLDRDVLRLKNGDTRDGIFVGLADGKIQIQHDDATTPTDLARVDRLTLGGALPARAIPSLSLRVRLLSGTVLTTQDIHWKVGSVAIADYAGTDRACPVDRIKSIDVLGGRVVWLADVDPARTQESSFIGTKWAMQPNANVMGGPLKIARTEFARGLGVHTNSTLEYKLDGTFTQLGFAVGIDDSAAPYGQADVKVLVDGKMVWEQKALKAGQPAVQQTLDLKDAHKVELISTSPGTMDVQGRVDWVNIGLIRP